MRKADWDIFGPIRCSDFLVGTARCAVRAAFSSGAMLWDMRMLKDVRSALADSGGDIAARCPYQC